MKHALIAGVALLSLTACQKQTISDPQPATAGVSAFSKGGGSGSGGGGTTTAGTIVSMSAPNGNRIIATHADSIGMSFNAPVPAGGYTITMSSSDPAIQFPATIQVPAGVMVAYAPYTTTATTSAHNVTITASLNGQSKSVVSKFFPLTATIAAPALQSPGNGSSFGFHRQVIFDWSDLNEAYYYEIQVSENTGFTTMAFNSGPLVSTTVADYFDGTGNGGVGTRYWRVRGVDASGNGGTWSVVRNFVVQPQ